MPRETAVPLTKERIAKLAKAGKPSEKYDGHSVGLRLRVTAPDKAVWRWGGKLKGRFAPPKTIGPAYKTGWTPGQVAEAQKQAQAMADQWATALEKDGFTPKEVTERAQAAKEVENRAQRLEDQKRPPILRDYIGKIYADHVREVNKDAAATLARIEKCFLDWEVPARARDEHPMLLGDWPITAVSQEVADEWKTWSLKAGKSKATVKRDLGALRAALSPAQCSSVEKWLKDAPFKVRNLKVNAEKPRYLMRGSKGEDNEYERLIAALDAREQRLRDARATNNARRAVKGMTAYPNLNGTYADEIKPLILTLLYTGLRIGEASALQWRDIDFASKRLTVRASTAKTDKTRTIAMNSALVEILKAWRQQSKGLGLVFYQTQGKNKGQPIGETKTFWGTLLRHAKIEGLRIHDLRHTFASWLVQEGVDLYRIKDLLGHSTIKITERYAHLSPDHGHEAVERLMA